MELTQRNITLKQRASIIRLLVILVAALLITNIVSMTLLYKTVSNKDVVLIPAGFSKQARITTHSVSASYIDQLAVMMVNQRLNVTPTNIEDSNASILLYVNPSYYASFKKQLDLDASSITSAKVSSAFYINSVQTNAVTMVAEIKGTLKRWVGDRLIGTSTKTYELKFSKHGYQLLLNSFVEVQKNGSN